MLVFIFADPSLGKVDKTSLSDETLLELLSNGFSGTELSKIASNPYRSFSLSNLIGITFSETGEVVGVAWQNHCIRGTIALEWLPPMTETAKFTSNFLSGTVELTKLPGALVVLDLSWNRFIGTLNFTELPNKLERLLLNRNDFHGRTDFTSLPDALWTLNVSDNPNLFGVISTNFSGVDHGINALNTQITRCGTHEVKRE